MKPIEEKCLRNSKIFLIESISIYHITATLNEFFMLWRVRKKVSIPLKAPDAPLFEYVN